MKFYRYDGVVIDGERTYPVLHVLNLFKETPKAYWVCEQWDHEGKFKKLVRKVSEKAYAYTSVPLARASFIARKKRQIEMLDHQLVIARAQLVSAQDNEWDDRSLLS